MISIDLTGNLSDHLIRYAICREVAERNNYKWGINPIVSHDYFAGKEQMFFFEDINYGESNNSGYGQLPPGITNVWEEKREHYPTHDYHPFQPDIFDIPDNTKLVIYCGQDARYLDKRKVKMWFKIKGDQCDLSESMLRSSNIKLDKNLCVINCRGGEYIGIPSLFLRMEYYRNAIQQMLKINSRMKFIVVTEDPNFFKIMFPEFPIYHFGIATDYYVVNHAKNLILSNSGFGLFPTWLNEDVENVIAPWGWSRHNIGIWSNSAVWTFGENKWLWLDKEGILHNDL